MEESGKRIGIKAVVNGELIERTFPHEISCLWKKFEMSREGGTQVGKEMEVHGNPLREWSGRC